MRKIDYSKHIRMATRKELDNISRDYSDELNIEKGWVYTNPRDKFTVVIVPNFFEDHYDPTSTMVNTLMMYDLKTNAFEGYIYPTDGMYNIIKEWELKQTLSPDTYDTFKDLL